MKNEALKKKFIKNTYMNIIKKISIPVIIFFTVYLFSGCAKLAEDKSNIYVYNPPPPSGGVISDATPLSGPIKGVMLTGKTYTLGGDIDIPAGDTLLVQPGV